MDESTELCRLTVSTLYLGNYLVESAVIARSGLFAFWATVALGIALARGDVRLDFVAVLFPRIAFHVDHQGRARGLIYRVRTGYCGP